MTTWMNLEELSVIEQHRTTHNTCSHLHVKSKIVECLVAENIIVVPRTEKGRERNVDQHIKFQLGGTTSGAQLYNMMTMATNNVFLTTGDRINIKYSHHKE